MNTSRPLSASRRAFLKGGAVLPAAAFASSQPGTPVPRIRLGKHSISRVICGANPFNGGSHLSVFFNHELRRYYTPDQVIRTLRRCEEVGINCWQAGPGNVTMHRRLLDEGAKMQFLAIDYGDGKNIPGLVQAGCIGVAHHGEHSDRLFKSGKLGEMQDYLKRVRDSGLQVGVSTHMPAVVDAVESKGWDVDYYMTCVYERHRSAADLEKLLGQAPIPVGEVYLPNDPPRMYKAIRQTRRPCLAFKILAAGRLSDRPEWVERAFRDTFENIKPADGIIVGMYDRISDQPLENANFARRFGAIQS